MGTLLLVRHGQAQAFSDQPDRLSALGWDQARALGSFWIRRRVTVEAAFHGSLRRQRETYDAVRGVHAESGKPFPTATVDPGLDEYAAQDLVRRIAPRLAESNSGFADLWKAWSSAASGADRNRHFQRMFEALARLWFEGRLAHPGLEEWAAFHARVESALARLRQGHRPGATVVAFTSGGPIGVAVQSCLGAPQEAALDINWRVRNSSLTTFLFSGARLSLDSFNETPHLAALPDLISFR